ncbi:hypothetical protein [Mariniflexile sp. HMF6888]
MSSIINSIVALALLVIPLIVFRMDSYLFLIGTGTGAAAPCLYAKTIVQ